MCLLSVASRRLHVKKGEKPKIMPESEIQEIKPAAAVAAPTARRFSLSKVRTFDSLRNPRYLLYFSSTLFHQASQNMQEMSRSLLVYRLTGTATTIGIMSLSGAVPHIFMSLFGGVAADRFQKKYILIVGMSLFGLVSLGVGVSLTTGILNPGTWWLLIISSVMQSSLMGLIVPARTSLVREIVGSENLMNAIALNQIGMGGLRMMAPAIAGFIIEFFGFEAVFYMMAGFYVMSAITISFLPKTRKIAATGKHAVAELTEGLRYLRGQRTLLFLLVLTLFSVLFSMPFQQMMPVFVDDVLKVGARGMGILLSLSGVGAISVSFILASLPNRKRGLLMLIGIVTLGVALMVFSFSRIWTLSLLMMVIVGMGQTLRGTLTNTLVQTHSADEYRGRVMGIYDMEMAFTSLATFTAAMVTDAFGVQWAIGGLALLLIMVGGTTMLLVPRIRQLE